MQKISTAAELKNAIRELEYRQANEWPPLREQFLATYESLKLINIIKGTFRDAISSPDLKTDLVDAAIGLTTGVIAKKVVVGNTHNPFKKILGIVVEMLVANKVAKNTDGIRSVGNMIFNKIFSKPGETETV